ncbi:MAG: hypothetical protein WDN75_10225 [Bacteroidota bacterium]
MKIQAIITAGLFVILTTSVLSVNAQSFDEPAIKILPTTQKGILKVHYVYDTNEPVNIRFFNDEEQLLSDEVTGTFPNGFSKKYDVRKMTSEAFWIEVTAENISVIYKLVRSRDKDTYVPFLEKTTYNHSLVASNN